MRPLYSRPVTDQSDARLMHACALYAHVMSDNGPVSMLRPHDFTAQGITTHSMGLVATRTACADADCATVDADRRDAAIMRLATCRAKRERTVGNWDVTVNHDSSRPQCGYFEHNVIGYSGGLWFEGRRLVDYDGVTELPTPVKVALADLGYVLDEFTR